MRMPYRISIGRSDARLCVLALLAFAWPARGLAVTVGPAEVTGSVGYNYRALNGAGDNKTSSNQLLVNLRANSYLWEPWLATIEGGVTLTQDATRYKNPSPGSGARDTDTSIVTGELNLNVLPQSRTPFGLRYLASNSRVDAGRISSAPVMFTNLDFDTRRLELRQSYLTEQNDRFMVRYDTSSWSSTTDGKYDDTLFGGELDFRRPKHNLLVKLSQGTTDQSLARLRNENLIFDLSHFYTASSALRVDTKASYYSFDRSFRVTSASATYGTSTSDIAQLSSFLFLRPEGGRLSLSGGLRAFRLEGKTAINNNDSLNLNGNAGAFYQYNKRLRFDGSVAANYADSSGMETRITRQQAGMLYQSDVVDLFQGSATWQWYANASADNQTNRNSQTGRGDTRQSAYGTLAHNGQKTWFASESSTIRLSLGQSMNGFYRFGGSEAITTQQDHQGTLTNRQFSGISSANTRLDHTGTLAWNQSAGGGSSSALLTLSDSRSLSDTKNGQQLINFQLTRSQPVTGSSFLTGNLTLQHVRQDFSGVALAAGNVTTATGRIDYQHSNLLGVTNLRFLSNLFISRATSQQAVDRAEWDNRLDYAIGLLDTSLSLRLIQIDGQNSNLLMFRVARRF